MQNIVGMQDVTNVKSKHTVHIVQRGSNESVCVCRQFNTLSIKESDGLGGKKLLHSLTVRVL